MVEKMKPVRTGCFWTKNLKLHEVFPITLLIFWDPKEFWWSCKRIYHLANSISSLTVQKQAETIFLNETITGITDNKKSQIAISCGRNNFSFFSRMKMYEIL